MHHKNLISSSMRMTLPYLLLLIVLRNTWDLSTSDTINNELILVYDWLKLNNYH